MPFIVQSRRFTVDTQGLEALDEIQPGDRCYVYYKPMVEAWRANPRWTTAHEIYRDMVLYAWAEDDDNVTAIELAWQVFFNLYVMPYELKKQKENGDI